MKKIAFIVAFIATCTVFTQCETPEGKPPQQPSEENTKVTGVSFDIEGNMNLAVNGSQTITATVEPQTAKNKKLVWKSEDETIATVFGGVVRGVGVGGPIAITATTDEGGFVARCTVTVSLGILGEGTLEGTLLTWRLTSDRVMTISGTGAMPDYSERLPQVEEETYSTSAPWFVHAAAIKTVVIEEGVTRIGNHAFAHCRPRLESISIPPSVTVIGTGAFKDCVGIETVEIPGSVATLENFVFEGCRSISELTIGKGVETIGDNAFYDCRLLTAVTVPGSVKTLGMRTFYFCTGLESVTLSEGLESLGGANFASCTKLTSITIPASVKEIKGMAFNGCTSLKDVTMLATTPPGTGYGSMQFSTADDTLHVPAGTLDDYKSVWGGEFTSVVELP